MVTFKKTSCGKRITVFTTVGALVGSGIIGCGAQAARQQDLVVTDVATGRINLDAVKDALVNSTDLSEFENRVNEIYEGDNLVLIRVEEEGAQKIISAFEDLNQSNTIEEAHDQKLFSITVDEQKYEIYGYGANDYYYYGSDYSDDYDYDYDYDYDNRSDSNKYDDKRRFMHWLMHASHSTRDPFVYQTSRSRAAQMRIYKDSFRNSDAYTAVRRANKAFFARQKARNPQSFRSRTNNISSQRSTYRQKQSSRIETSRSGRSAGSMRPGS